MMKNIIISKLDAARQQLITAIRLYFNTGDIVPIHTLTAAAFRITQNISDSSANLPDSITNWVEELVKPEGKKLFWNKFHETTNFFKHAEKDPDSIHEFNPEFTEYLLFLTARQYLLLSSEEPPEIQLFFYWFMLQKPNIFASNKELQKKVQFSGYNFSGYDKNQFWREAMPILQEKINSEITGQRK